MPALIADDPLSWVYPEDVERRARAAGERAVVPVRPADQEDVSEQSLSAAIAAADPDASFLGATMAQCQQSPWLRDALSVLDELEAQRRDRTRQIEAARAFFSGAQWPRVMVHMHPYPPDDTLFDAMERAEAQLQSAVGIAGVSAIGRKPE